MTEVLKKFWAGWKKVALRVARFQTIILLTVFYFVILVPFGGLARLFRWDPLETSKRHLKRGSNWKKTRDQRPDLKSMYRMS